MNGKNKGGRPLKYTAGYILKLRDSMEKYIDETKIPIVAEFAYLNYVPRNKLYEFKELKDTIKRLIDKKEAELEREGLSKNSSMAIFSLKQLGWRDSIEHTGKDGKDLITDVKITIVK